MTETLSTLSSIASSDTEEFVINDIYMNIKPSDMLVFDDNKVIEQSFIRTNSVFCYRSKYSDTKIVLNFPFKIHSLGADLDDSLNNTYNCLKLIVELNNYPYCFIKSKRVQTYISPMNTSATGFLIFAVEELALVQSAIASDIMILEVTLKYFNHAPLAADFKFVSNQVISKVITDNDNIAFPYDLLSEDPPDLVDDLYLSDVWSDYVHPKVIRLFERLNATGLLKQFNEESETHHAGLDVKISIPMISENAEKGEFMMAQASDGTLIGEGTKIIAVTDTDPLDDLSYADQIGKMFSQDFTKESDKTADEKIADLKSKLKRKGMSVDEEFLSNIKDKDKNYSQTGDLAKSKSTIDKDGTMVGNPFDSKNNKIAGGAYKPDKTLKELFVQYSSFSLSQSGIRVSKVEVRKTNNLVVHKIGSYKHPIIQFLGRNPSQTIIEFVNNSEGLYEDNTNLGISAFLTNAFQTLDDNRRLFPSAEAYNYIKIFSLANILLDCENAVPGQNNVSTSGSQSGIEYVNYTFHESKIDNLLEELSPEASGAKSTSKALEDSYAIIINWLKGFSTQLKASGNDFSKLSITSEDANKTLEIYRNILRVISATIVDMGYTNFADNYIAKTINYDLDKNNITTNNSKNSSSYIIEPKLSESGYVSKIISSRNVQDTTKDLKVTYTSVTGAQSVTSTALDKSNYFKWTTEQYYSWVTNYGISILSARVAVMNNQAVPMFKNVAYREKTGNLPAILLNVMKLIDSSTKTNSTTMSSLTDSQKYFLNNVSDQYIGSLYGQAIPDLKLEDLDPNYDKTKDVLIQTTDPFFFLHCQPLLADEMTDFFNNSYNSEYTTPQWSIDEQDKEVKEPKQQVESTKMGNNYRQLVEVDFNADNFSYGDMFDSNGKVQGTGWFTTSRVNSGKIAEDVNSAIEAALLKYGKSGDQELRIYMKKVAMLESSYGTNLKSGTSSAAGLYQFIPRWAFAEILRSNNKIFPEKNLSDSQSVAVANRYAENPNFKTNYNISAQMFIEYFLLNGGKKYNSSGKFDEVATYAVHHLGPNGAKPVVDYAKGSGNGLAYSKDISGIGLNVNNAKGYYSVYSQKMKSISLPNVPNSSSPTQSTTTKDITSKNMSALDKQLTGIKQSNVSNIFRNSQTGAGNRLIGKVTKVWDGDTFDMTVYLGGAIQEVRVRLAGIDTDEINHGPNATANHKDNTKTIKWGEKAKARLNTLVLNKSVTVDRTGLDNTEVRENGKIRYIGKVLIGEKDVSKTLLLEGLAKLQSQFNSNQDYAAALKYAQTNKIGRWSNNSNPDQEAAKQVKVSNENKKKIENILQDSDNKIKHNTYQPFQGGKKFPISSDFNYEGETRTVKGKTAKHNGLDFRCAEGTIVVAAAAGIANVRQNPGGYGLYIVIDHKNGFETRYGHLSKALIKSGQHVSSQQVIAQSGNTGRSTGAHLHYEVRFKGKPIHPYSTKYELSNYVSDVPVKDSEVQVAGGISNTGDISNGEYQSLQYSGRLNINSENTVYNEAKLADAIFYNAKKYVNAGFKVAIPSIKAYLIYGNENDGLGLTTIFSGSQYYELKGVQSFDMVCNNDSNPVDVAILSLINPSFMRTDAWTNLSTNGENVGDITRIGTDYEKQMLNTKTMLRNGAQIQIRMGYGNDVNDLDIVFNGGITEVNGTNNSQIVTMVLEGYGKEFLQEILNPSQPETISGGNAPTTTVLGTALNNRSIDHFGYMSTHFKSLIKQDADPESRNMSSIFNQGTLFNFSSIVHKSRLFMNIFAPEIEKVDDTFASRFKQLWPSLGVSNQQFGYPFYVHRMTAWDCCKQMEYRHPGTIFKPLIFEDRMTAFYGVKEQMYFCRDLSKYSQYDVRKKLNSGIQDAQVTNYYERRRERMAPVCNIHFASSSTNLISNQMNLNNKWYNTTNVSYFTSDDSDDFSEKWNWESTKMTVDDNLMPWEIREKQLQMSGTFGKYVAFLYGTTDLKKEAESMYGGKIFLLGNPSIKAGDYIFLDDVENRMSGLMLVRECVHRFNSQTGYTTEITPGLYVEPANFMYTDLWLKLLCSFKVGSSKVRLVQSTSYGSDYAMVADYMRAIQQIDVLNPNGSGTDTDLELLKYVGAITLPLAISWSLSKKIGGSKILLGDLTKASYATVSALLRGADAEIFNKGVIGSIRNDKIYKKGMSFLKKGSTKARALRDSVIASRSYVNTVNKVKTYRKTTFILRALRTVTSFSYNIVGRVAMRTAGAVVAGLLAASGVGLLLDLLAVFAISWASAKIEEVKLTRQPLLYFPIIKNGKPFQAGMTGAIRNDIVDGLTTEFGKTWDQITKAAAILKGSNDVNNNSTSFLVNYLAKKALDKRDTINKLEYTLDYELEAKTTSESDIQNSIKSKQEAELNKLQGK